MAKAAAANDDATEPTKVEARMLSFQNGMIFNLDGTVSRKRRDTCKQCGLTEHCDNCWEHVSDLSPFRIWHCLLCRMPKAIFDGGLGPNRCEFCGWDEATETRSSHRPN